MAKKLVVTKFRHTASSDIDNHLRRYLIGQERPIQEITRSLKRAEAGFQNPNRPLAVLAFFGPTGVGKTYTAELLADKFIKFVWRCPQPKECGGFEISDADWRKLPSSGEYTSPICLPHMKKKKTRVGLLKYQLPKMWKINCGQLSDMAGFNVNTLLGAPPGYLGYDKAPFFTGGKAPKVVLFDEIEKVILSKYSWGENSGVSDILLNILDTGRTVNNAGDEVDFTQSIIILTGNLGAQEIQQEFEKAPFGFISEGKIRRKISQISDQEIEALNKKIYQIVKKKAEKEFAPEFVNRLDRLVVFRFLTQKHYREILNRELEKIQLRITRSPTPFRMELAPNVRKLLVDEAFSDRHQGARPLNRVLDKRLTTPLADLAIQRAIPKGALVKVKVEKGELTFYQETEKTIKAATQEGAR